MILRGVVFPSRQFVVLVRTIPVGKGPLARMASTTTPILVAECVTPCAVLRLLTFGTSTLTSIMLMVPAWYYPMVLLLYDVLLMIPTFPTLLRTCCTFVCISLRLLISRMPTKGTLLETGTMSSTASYLHTSGPHRNPEMPKTAGT